MELSQMQKDRVLKVLELMDRVAYRIQVLILLAEEVLLELHQREKQLDYF